MRILVCGGRFYRDRARLFWELDRVHALLTVTELAHGAATGADSLAEEWARQHSVWTVPFPAQWSDLSHPDAVIKTRRLGSQYDAKAGVRRNQIMLDVFKPVLVVAFPGGKGTADMVGRAHKARVPVNDIGESEAPAALEVVEGAFAAFDQWRREHDPEGDMNIAEQADRYAAWCVSQRAA